MNLIIDIGNSYAKVAVFKLDSIITKTSIEIKYFKKNINSFLKTYPDLKHCILSSVGVLDSDTIIFLEKHLTVIVLNHETKLPFNNNYKTPKTLGVDRLALIAAASLNYSKQNVVVIDAGTCITYDLLTANNDYLGGAISLRYKALNNFTKALPLLKKTTEIKLVGNDTISCIHSGCLNGIVQEIDGVILQYHNMYKDLTVILTGGDTIFLSKQLKVAYLPIQISC